MALEDYRKPPTVVGDGPPRWKPVPSRPDGKLSLVFSCRRKPEYILSLAWIGFGPEIAVFSNASPAWI